MLLKTECITPNSGHYRYNRGYTLIELLASSALGIIILGATFSSAITGKKILNREFKTTKLTQNLRSAIDLVGIEIRLAGEQLPANLPAVELINGVGNEPDQLILRRNLLSEVLTVCTNLNSGQSNSQVIFATGDGTVDTGITSSACVFSDPGQVTNLNAWRNFRITQGGATQAYIYDLVAKHGEFFPYHTEGSTADIFFIGRSSGVWSRNYPYISSSLYLLEEHRYRLVDGSLEFIRNTNWSSPSRIISSLTNFQVLINFTDGTTATELPASGSRLWTDIKNIEVTIEGEEKTGANMIKKRISSSFYPRNILSN
jgi:hypothetical protein